MPLFQPFVFEGENFVQADTVYHTDVCIFLNRTGKKLYLWAGKRVTKDTLDEALRAWTKFAEKYQDFQVTNLIAKKELTDFELAREIRALLGQHEDEAIAEKAKSNFNLAAKISKWLGIFFLVAVVLQGLIMLVFPIQGDLLVISEADLTLFFDSASILLYVTFGVFIVTFIFAMLGRNTRVAVPSCLAIFVTVGFWFYISQRDFLFYFQDYGTIPGMVQILAIDVLIFVGILASIVLGVFLLYFVAARTRPKLLSSSKMLPVNQDSVQEIPSKNTV